MQKLHAGLAFLHRHVKGLETELGVLKETFKKNDLKARMDKFEKTALENDLLNRVIALEKAAAPTEGQ